MGVVVEFPLRPKNADNAMLVGQHLRDSFPVPARDPELALLAQMAETLLGNLTDHHVDTFLTRLEAWERENLAG